MSKIRYACASLIAGDSQERKSINLDFSVDDSNKFNKIVFPLTSRSREYLANIPLEEKLEWAIHAQLPQLHKDHNGPSWIGKAQTRQIFIPGKIKKSHRLEKTGAILTYNETNQNFNLKCWIEDWHIEITLYPSGNIRFPFKGEYRRPEEKLSVKGDWV